MSLPVCPAHRGDIAILVSERTDWVIAQNNDGPRRTVVREEVEITLVVSVTRQGTVKAVRDAWGNVHTLRSPRPRILMLPAQLVDPPAAMQVAIDHHWPGHPGQPKPFDSVDEVRKALRHLRRDVVQLDNTPHATLESD